MPPSFSFELLGCFRATSLSRKEAGKSERRLLALLGIHRRPMSRLQVAESLWPDVDRGHALGRLRTALWRLRDAGDELVACDGDLLLLDPHCSVDVEFALAIAEQILAAQPASLTGSTLIDFFDRDLLVDWDETWVDYERELFRDIRVRVLEASARRELEVGNQVLAIKACRAAIRCSPYRDTAHRLLIRALWEEGNPAAALRHLLDYRDELARDLGLAPCSVLPDLYEQLAR